jgi:GNAT superfamily N-acetyltransferase
MTVQLRVATIGDAALLAELGARLFAQTFGGANTPEDMAAYLESAFSRERQAAELAEADRMTWIAEDAAGNAVGYAVLIRGVRFETVNAERPAEVRRIYVDLSAPAAGAAQLGGPRPSALLMNRCVEQAREWGCDVIWLAVWEENPRAIRFYEKNGFQKVGVKDFQLGTDLQHDFVMARNL